MPSRKKRPSRASNNGTLGHGQPDGSQEDMLAFVDEAEKVGAMTETPGWEIIRRDFMQYQGVISTKLAYLHPRNPDFYEARLSYMAADKLLKMVEDYETNRVRTIEMIRRLADTETSVPFDMDVG